MPLLIGAGGSPAGTTDAGYGSVDAAAIPSPNLFNDPYAPRRLDSRRIDPVTRDYVMDASGSILGMTRGQQAVELALLTNLGSSCVATIGNSLSDVKVIADSFINDISAKVNQALSAAVAAGMITVVDVKVQRVGASGAFIVTRWRDLSTGQEQTRYIGSGS